MDTSNKKFGSLIEVELRNYWPDEAKDFTPWLAERENLMSLCQEIGLDLEVMETEKTVGSFKADILAKDTQNDQMVIIENQLEKTDHIHLGQLLTYAAGVNASAIIWIARKFTEEHRQALDWLNEMTTSELAMFGIEIHLLKIENLPAPYFKIISQPNNWTTTIKQSKNNPGDLSNVKMTQLEFWTGLKEYFENHNFSLNLRKPLPQHSYSMAIGTSGVELTFTTNSCESKVGCEIYIYDSENTPYYENLFKCKDEIEAEIGSKLEWRPLSEKKASRIILYQSGNVMDRDSWSEIFQWLRQTSEKFFKAFTNRI